MTKEGLFPGIQYPRVPGHEVAGIVDAVGAGVVGWTKGQRVGVGWHGGYCGHCDACRRGDFFACQWGQVTGITYDGGYADYMVVIAAIFTSALTEFQRLPIVGCRNYRESNVYGLLSLLLPLLRLLLGTRSGERLQA